jgi:hypothetical protein
MALNMFKRNAWRKLAVTAGLALATVFSTVGVSPDIVWCHKPDGRITLEFAPEGKVCSCDDCCLYRHEHRHDQEAGAAVAGHSQAGGSTLAAAHCIHVPFLDNSPIRHVIDQNSGLGAMTPVPGPLAEPVCMAVNTVMLMSGEVELFPPGRSPAPPFVALDILRL